MKVFFYPETIWYFLQYSYRNSISFLILQNIKNNNKLSMKCIRLLIISFLFISIYSCNNKKVEKLSIEGKNIVTESGEIIRLTGVSFSDPDKLERDGQWNPRYFQEAKNWGCNVVRFP
ncbi:MAG: hypothetical protein R3182_10890, partial [Draconibacterium sp.]|nr:hypothetical protein [Draconibacterium sp.]